MPVVARMVSRAKWTAREGFGADEIPADAISDLRTQENTLSFWRVADNDDPWWQEVALALAAARDQLAPIDVVKVDESLLQAAAGTLENTRGNTPVGDLVERHVDASHLDSVRLCAVARIVLDAVGEVRRLTRKEVKKLLADAIEGGRLAVDSLHEKLRNEIRA